LKIQVKLGSTQETVLIPFLARVKKLEQVKPIVNHPKSGEIIKQLDYDFEKYFNTKYSLIASCLREIIIDNWNSIFLYQYIKSTVLEICPDLYTRFQKFDKAKVPWFDLDLLDLIKLRQVYFLQILLRPFSGSVLENDWIERVKEKTLHLICS